MFLLPFLPTRKKLDLLLYIIITAIFILTFKLNAWQERAYILSLVT